MVRKIILTCWDEWMGGLNLYLCVIFKLEKQIPQLLTSTH